MLQERPLSQQAREAGILFDGIVRLGKSSKPDARPDHPIRLILIKTNPHTQRGKQPGGKAVEIFFRFFKHILGCRHLLSQDPVGIEIQMYMAIIELRRTWRSSLAC